jgi:hypothetical protein
VVIAAVLSGGWLLTIILYWRLRRQLSKPASTTPPTSQNDRAPELFAQVMHACTQNNAQAAYTTLGQWVRATSPGTPTLDQWLRRQEESPESSALVNAAENLQQQIYREENATWNGAELASALNVWRKRKDKKSNSDSALPALYPT